MTKKIRIFNNFSNIFLLIIVTFIIISCARNSGMNFYEVGKIENWLAKQKGGENPNNPISFKVTTNLQNMASPESNWHKLLTSINTAGLYIALDLSECTMPSSIFNADGEIKKGKQFIVSLILPKSTQKIAGILPVHFKNLKSVRASKIDFFIGMTGPGGGLIFFDKGEYSDGWRFLEAAPTDIPIPLRWSTQDNQYSKFIEIPDTLTEIGTGKNNTTSILISDISAPAALAAVNYSNNGKTDWFLPSRDELNLIYENLHKNGLGGFSNDIYWSSSQAPRNSAWQQVFNGFDRHGGYRGKFVTNSIRPIRSF